jgi:hypothetical protein
VGGDRAITAEVVGTYKHAAKMSYPMAAGRAEEVPANVVVLATAST